MIRAMDAAEHELDRRRIFFMMDAFKANKIAQSSLDAKFSDISKTAILILGTIEEKIKERAEAGEFHYRYSLSDERLGSSTFAKEVIKYIIATLKGANYKVEKDLICIVISWELK